MTAVVKKYQAQGCEFIDGSTSEASYLVIAFDPATGARLGLKMQVEGQYFNGKQALAFDARFRVAPGSDGQDGWSKSFNMPWTKNSPSRCSVNYLALISRGSDDAWMARYDLEALNYTQKLLEIAKAAAPEKTWVVDAATFKAYVTDSLEELMAKWPAPTKEHKQQQIAALEAQLAALKEEVQAMASAKDLVTPVDHPMPDPLDENTFWKNFHGADSADEGDGDGEGDGEEEDEYEDD